MTRGGAGMTKGGAPLSFRPEVHSRACHSDRRDGAKNLKAHSANRRRTAALSHSDQREESKDSMVQAGLDLRHAILDSRFRGNDGSGGVPPSSFRPDVHSPACHSERRDGAKNLKTHSANRRWTAALSHSDRSGGIPRRTAQVSLDLRHAILDSRSRGNDGRGGVPPSSFRPEVHSPACHSERRDGAKNPKAHSANRRWSAALSHSDQREESKDSMMQAGLDLRHAFLDSRFRGNDGSGGVPPSSFRPEVHSPACHSERRDGAKNLKAHSANRRWTRNSPP